MVMEPTSSKHCLSTQEPLLEHMAAQSVRESKKWRFHLSSSGPHGKASQKGIRIGIV